MKTEENIAKHRGQAAGESLDARERLLAAASELMRETDTIRLSIRQISDRAGLNLSLIGYYFGNKEGLQLATIERDTAPAIEKIRALDPAAAPVDRLRRYIAISVDALFRYPYLNRLTLAILRDFEEARAREVAERILRPLYLCARGIIEDGIASGDFRPIDPDFGFFLIQGCCTQIFSSNAAFPFVLQRGPLTAAEVEEFSQRAADVLIQGFANPPPG